MEEKKKRKLTDVSFHRITEYAEFEKNYVNNLIRMLAKTESQFYRIYL